MSHKRRHRATDVRRNSLTPRLGDWLLHIAELRNQTSRSPPPVMSNSTVTHVIKLNHGTVQLHTSDGSYVRTVCSGATFAVVQGHEVHVTLANGHVRIFGVDGSYKRTL